MDPAYGQVAAEPGVRVTYPHRYRGWGRARRRSEPVALQCLGGARGCLSASCGHLTRTPPGRAVAFRLPTGHRGLQRRRCRVRRPGDGATSMTFRAPRLPPRLRGRRPRREQIQRQALWIPDARAMRSTGGADAHTLSRGAACSPAWACVQSPRYPRPGRAMACLSAPAGGMQARFTCSHADAARQGLSPTGRSGWLLGGRSSSL
jgi:hypothetical protein